MSKRQRLIQRLLQASETMVQGGLSETSRRCGNPNCICSRDPDRLHGPHLYITFREGGKSRSLYVPPEHAEAARQAQQAWAEFWNIGCSLAQLNRERLRKQWQGERQARPANGPKRKTHD
jgi:Family of unknown function (DUF6788)